MGYYPRKQAAPPSGRKNRGSLPRPLKKAIRKKPRKRVDRTQNAAIMKLSKQVKSLQVAKHGKVQKNFQTTVSPVFPQADKPIMLDLTDFTCFNAALGSTGARLYTLDNAQLPVVVTNWETAQQIGNPFWENKNYDIVDTGSYLPMYAKIVLKFTGRPHLVDCRIRVDLVSLKADAFRANSPGTPTLVPPASLPYLQNLATPTINRISRDHFRVYATKFCYINSKVGVPDGPAPNVKGTTGNTQFITMTVRPKKPRWQAKTYPVAGTLEPTNPLIEPDFGAFGPTNVPIDQPLWLLISTNNVDGTADETAVVCTCSRTCVWRDTIGSSNM